MGLLRSARRSRSARPAAGEGERADFGSLAADQVYLDAACQSLRPQPVLDAMSEYFTEYPACGDRVQYAWGRRVEERVEHARAVTLAALDVSPRRFACSFTLNTTYGLNLLLQQLPAGRFRQIITSHHEHNAVFLSTMTAARRLGIARTVVLRTPGGRIELDGEDLTDAVVVLSAMDNVTGTLTADLSAIIDAVHRAGGIVIIDAAQAAPHALGALRGIGADAICFSGHKLYAPALGIVVATNELLASLELTFVGGGQVDEVTTDDFTPSAHLHTRLEPGLQAWGEIIAFGAALDWFVPRMAEIDERERRLGERLYDGLAALPHVQMFSPAASAVVSLLPERVDAHRLAVFLSQADISVRSGHFCAHHWLREREDLPPLVRFSIGAHSSDADIERALDVMGRMMRGL